MVVRVYIEGGAEGHTADKDFRRGWGKFLRELRDLAHAYNFKTLDVIRGKGRSNAYERFVGHRKQCPGDLCVLIVDSECPVQAGDTSWGLVAGRQGDRWERPPGAIDDDLFLMVESVETWLLTDPDALERFFGRGFRRNALPTNDLETRTKANVAAALLAATRDTKKGRYRHGQAHEILENVRPENVKQLSHGRRLFEGLGNRIRANA